MSDAVSFVCPVCNLSLHIKPERFPLHCRCGYMQLSAAAGLGDIVAAKLHWAGVTKARYLAAKSWLGLHPDCNCPERQAWLNEIGRKFGIG